MPDDTPRETALADVRDALATLHTVPVTGLDAEKAETVLEVAETVESLEKQLANEVDQLAEDDDG